MKLHQLKKKRAVRVRKRKHHYRAYRKFKKAGKHVRQRWHRVRFQSQVRAIRKLDRLIKAEQKRLRIDWSGCNALTFPPLLKAVRVALTVPGLYVTSTNGGSHSTYSWHYQDRAVDFGSNSSTEKPEIAAQELLLRKFGATYFRELFGPANWYVKDGVIKAGTFPNHDDHLHVAVT